MNKFEWLSPSIERAIESAVAEVENSNRCIDEKIDTALEEMKAIFPKQSSELEDMIKDRIVYSIRYAYRKAFADAAELYK